MIMSEEDVERALRNVKLVEEARNSNATRLDGCPLDQFLRSHVPDPNCVMGAWSDAVYRSRHWSGEDESYLSKNYGAISVKDLSARIGRTEKSIRMKAERMGLK